MFAMCDLAGRVRLVTGSDCQDDALRHSASCTQQAAQRNCPAIYCGRTALTQPTKVRCLILEPQQALDLFLPVSNKDFLLPSSRGQRGPARHDTKEDKMGTDEADRGTMTVEEAAARL